MTDIFALSTFSPLLSLFIFQARLWIQIMKQLRHGVKLKKVEHCAHSLQGEYELTPYEMLMKDIVFKRYTLNKIMVGAAWPLFTCFAAFVGFFF